MGEQNTGGKIPLTIYLSAEVAARLTQTAERQKRPAPDVAVELLERHLPRSSAAGAKPGNIPYA